MWFTWCCAPGSRPVIFAWSEFCFGDVVQFVTAEFQRLTSRATQRMWLMVLRSFLRYLAAEGHISGGWDAALPSVANRQHLQLPRGLTPQQVRALWTASEGFAGNTVTVIDGATNGTATVAVGLNPMTLAVNPATNKIYVANSRERRPQVQ